MFVDVVRSGAEFLKRRWSGAADVATTSASTSKAGPLFNGKTAVKALGHLVQFPDPVVDKLEKESSEKELPKFKVRVERATMGDASILRKTDEIIARDEGPRCWSFALLVRYYPAELERLRVVEFLLDRALYNSDWNKNPYTDALKWGLEDSDNAIELYRISRVFERIDEALSSDDADVQSRAIYLAGKLIRSKNSVGLVPLTTVPKLEKLLISSKGDVRRDALSAFIDIAEGVGGGKRTDAGVNMFRPETYRALTLAMHNSGSHHVVYLTLGAIERSLIGDQQLKKIDIETIGNLIGIVGSKELQKINEATNNILDKVLAYQKANGFPAFGQHETHSLIASYAKRSKGSGYVTKFNYQQRTLLLARIGKFVDAIAETRKGVSKKWRRTLLNRRPGRVAISTRPPRDGLAM